MKNKTKKNLTGYLFLLPSFLFLAAFLFYPFARSVVMSFTNWTGANAWHFTGLTNYADLAQNAGYWKAIRINLLFAILSTLIQTVLGFLLAHMVFYLQKKEQDFFKVTLYLPVILPISIVAIMWRFFLSPYHGLVNTILKLVGLSGLTHGWIGERATALGSLIFVNTWQYIGFTFILYFVSMQGIPKEVLESASIDGAGRGMKLIHIFIPLTMETTETNVLLSITGGMKSFALFYMLTGGGPGTATRVVSMLIYETAFNEFKYYRALAMATMLSLILLVITAIIRYLSYKRRKMYDVSL